MHKISARTASCEFLCIIFSLRRINDFQRRCKGFIDDRIQGIVDDGNPDINLRCLIHFGTFFRSILNNNTASTIQLADMLILTIVKKSLLISVLLADSDLSFAERNRPNTLERICQDHFSDYNKYFHISRKSGSVQKYPTAFS